MIVERGDIMAFARIVYRNKEGWRTGKYVYYAAEELQTIENFAKKTARGREYRVQTDYTPEQIERMFRINAVCVL